MNAITRWTVGAVIGITLSGAAAAQTTLNFSNWISPQAPFIKDAVMVWAKQVEDSTSGRVKIRLLPKAVTSPPQHFDAVRDGLADVTFFVHGYTPGRFVVTNIAELPFLGDNAVSVAVAYNRVFEQMLNKADEHQGVRVLSVFTHGPGALFLGKKSIQRIEDLAGLKIRTSGGVVNDVGRALGVSGMLKPATEVYEMFKSGVADGAFFSKQSILTFKMETLVKQAVLVPGGLFNTSFSLLINPARFNALSAEDQKIIISLSGDAFARLAGRSFQDSDEKAIELMRSNKAEIITTSPAMTEQIRKLTEPVVENWIKQASAKGFDGRAAIEAMRAEVAKVKP